MELATLAQLKRDRFSVTGSLSRALLFAVPSVSARTLGVYRILFGAVFLTFFWANMDPGRLGSLAAHGPRFYLNSWTILSDLSALPQVRSAVYYGVLLSLCFFTVGLFTRVAFACLVVGFWLTALFSNDGHFITPLLLAITVTATARWGAGLSLDELFFRRGDDGGGPSPEFGYPIWLMGLCISLAYTAAGISKLYLTGGDWIWEGGARWGFIVDMKDAATLLGPIIINSLPLAILASVFSALGQIAYIYSCFTRSLLIKSAIGLFIALPFLIGLILLMGLFWWPWFTLVMLWYLPWTKIDGLLGGKPTEAVEQVAPTGQRNWAAGAAAVLILGHAYVVAKGIEFEPLFSSYPMYALAYPMGSDWEEERWQDFAAGNSTHVYRASVESSDGRITDISQRYRSSIVLWRTLSIASLYRRADPEWIWISVEQGLTSDLICDVQRDVLADFDPGQTAAKLIYERDYFDLVDGKIVWSSKDKVLRVSVGPDDCSYAWTDDEA